MMTNFDQELSLNERIKNGEFKRIVVLTGAGISTGAGIPDYRSEGGIFNELMGAFPLVTTPEMLLSRSFVNQHKVFEHEIFLKHVEAFKNATPTNSHKLCKWLHDKGWLVRVYTQNIDGLHQKVGLSDDMIVEYHGSLIKNNIVLYDDKIPSTVLNQSRLDFTNNLNPIDLVLVLGTSLKVFPFGSLPDKVPYGTMKLLVDNDPNHEVGKKWKLLEFRHDFINEDVDYWANLIMS